MDPTDTPAKPTGLALFVIVIALQAVAAAAIGADYLGGSDHPGAVAFSVAVLCILPATLLTLWLMRYTQRVIARLRLEKTRAELTLDAIGDAVIRYDLQGRLCYLNQAARQLTGIECGELHDIAVEDAVRLFDHRTRQSIVAGLLDAAASGQSIALSSDTRLLNEHGIELEIQGNCRAILDDQGGMRAIVLILRDVTEEREWMRQQLDLWDRDPLTALPGQRYLENRLSKVLLTKRTVDLPMTYLQVHLAGVAAFIQQEGREAGDALIRHVVALLRSRVRDTDLIARVGEHVFGVLLTRCPPEISARIETELRAALAVYRFDWAGRTHDLSASMSGMQIPPFEGTVDELLAQLDATRQ